MIANVKFVSSGSRTKWLDCSVQKLNPSGLTKVTAGNDNLVLINLNVWGE